MQIDRQKAIEKLGIPPELYDILLQSFVKEAGETIDKIQELKKTDSVEEIRKLAHFIKGSAGNLSVVEIYEIAKEIEYFDAGKNDKGFLEERIAGLAKAWAELKGILQV